MVSGGRPVIIELLSRGFFWACVGLLIECVFTGIGSALRGDKRLQCTTYLWLAPVYATAALVLEAVSGALPWPWYLKVFAYVPIIFAAEALFGWISLKALGKVLWDYGRSAWTPMGLINLKYAHWWLLAGTVFEGLHYLLGRTHVA